MTVLLLALGGAGVVGLLVGLALGDVDIDLGPDWVSLPALAALVGAFGFTSAAVLSFGAPLAVALATGTVVGLVLAAATVRLARGLMDMRTDGPVRTADMVGRPGRVVTALTPDRTGEVLVDHAGQRLKVAARGDEVIAVGARVVVVDVVSPTLVAVESHDRFWAPDTPTALPPTRDPGGPTP